MGGGSKKTPIPKICHTYPAQMKLGTVIPYLKKIQKYKNHMTHRLSSSDIRFFSQENVKFCFTKKHRYKLHFHTWVLILLNFFESLKIVLINMVTNSMMLAKSILKQKLWRDKFCPWLTNKILSYESSYIIDVVMWPKFGNSSISVREVITSIL